MIESPGAAETQTVSFTVTGLQRLAAGRIAGLANIEMDIGGVVFALQGVQIVRSNGSLAVVAPQFRDGAGKWRSAVLLPDTLRDALGAEILSAYGAV